MARCAINAYIWAEAETDAADSEAMAEWAVRSLDSWYELSEREVAEVDRLRAEVDRLRAERDEARGVLQQHLNGALVNLLYTTVRGLSDHAHRDLGRYYLVPHTVALLVKQEAERLDRLAGAGSLLDELDSTRARLASAQRERDEALKECEELRGALVWIVGLLPPGEYDMDAIDEAGTIARSALKPEGTP